MWLCNIHAISSYHLQTILVHALYLHCIYVISPTPETMCCYKLRFVGGTGACVDIEPLSSLQSEEGSSWPHFESGGPSFGSPSNPWPWVSLSPLMPLLSGWGLFFQPCSCKSLAFCMISFPYLISKALLLGLTLP